MDKEKASLERNDKDEVVISLNDIPGEHFLHSVSSTHRKLQNDFTSRL